MRHQYVWLIWSAAFLIPWLILYAALPGRRRAMRRTSALTALFGLTEPIFVPRYWNPPSLFNLAQRTGFDIESLVFCFAIGGIGLLCYDVLSGSPVAPVSSRERHSSRHRFHRLALLAPVLAFLPLYLVPWNPIYASIASLAIGAVATMACRPDLSRRMLLGGALFGSLYAMFVLGLRWSAPGYIAQVWNLADLSGVVPAGIPLEEILFGITFGMYWSGVHEHLTWHRDLQNGHAATVDPGQVQGAQGSPRPRSTTRRGTSSSTVPLAVWAGWRGPPTSVVLAVQQLASLRAPTRSPHTARAGNDIP